MTEETLNAIVDGTFEPLQTIEESGEVRFSAKDLPDGTYSFVAVSFLNKEAMEYDMATFKYESVGTQWNSLGMGYYTEDCLLNWFTEDVCTYEVEIQEDAAKPGVYRMINPYGAPFPYNEEGDWDASRDWNIVVNAEDPDGVYILKQETGLDWGYGMFVIQSTGAYFMEDGGYDFDTVKGAGYMGTLKDGHITFPEKGLIRRMGTDYGPSYGNASQKAEIILPGYTSSNKKAVKAGLSVKRQFIPGAVNSKILIPGIPSANTKVNVINRHFK